MPKLKDWKAKYRGETIDDRPGFYYVSVMDAGRFGLIAGPFDNHPAAIAMVEPARAKAEEVNDRAIWYAYGTCRMESDAGPGILNDLLKGGAS